MDAPVIDLKIIPELLRLPSSHVWSDYDSEGDVLYLSFENPQCANDSIMEDDGNIYHYRGTHLVGLTIPNAKARFEKMPE